MNIEQRLDRLERQNRRLKGGLGLLLLTVVVGLLLGFAGQEKVPDVVKAKAFHVVTDDGKVLLKLEDTLGLGIAGTLTAMNGKGQILVRLAATTGGEGAVVTMNGKGQELVSLMATTDGEGMVTTLDGKGQALVRLVATARGEGGVLVHDPSGKKSPGVLVPGE